MEKCQRKPQEVKQKYFSIFQNIRRPFRRQNSIKILKVSSQVTRVFKLRHLLGEKGGSGKKYDIPPSNFRADISDEKERKREFLTAGREETKLSKEYQDWLRETCDLFSASVAKRETKMGEQIQITEGSTIKLIRERSCGRNIFDYLLQGGGERGVYSCHNE